MIEPGVNLGNGISKPIPVDEFPIFAFYPKTIRDCRSLGEETGRPELSTEWLTDDRG